MLNIPIPHCDILRTDCMVGSFAIKKSFAQILPKPIKQKQITTQAQDSAADKEQKCF